MVDSTRDRLLLACAKGRWHPEALEQARRIVCQRDVDWDEYYARVAKHSMAPLIYHTLRDDDTILPASVKERLRSAYYQSARRNTLLYQELHHVVHAFNEAQMPAILLKGVGLATAAYGNVALRPMADIDIMVRTEDMLGAEKLLLDHGYEVRDHAHSYVRHATLTRESRGWSAHIEVHRHIVSSAYYRRSIPEEWLWKHSIVVTIDDNSALVLSPEAAILHTCLHMLDHIAAEGTLLWLCDIVEIARRHDIDWDALVGRTAQFKIALPVRSILRQTKELLDLPMPDDILQRMLAYQPGFLEKKAYESCLSPSRSSASKTFLDFLAVEGLGTKFGLVISRLFPSRDYMVARYSIRNPRLVPVYYPYMIARAVLDSLRASEHSQPG